MIVVADTAPLNYLVLIRAIELLQQLFENVLIPPEVHRELSQPGSPMAVQRWAANLPAWSEVRSLTGAPDPTLNDLDPGEREAIQLALEAGADILLIDEIEGRREALRRHLRVSGTLSVLEKAAQRGLIDFRSALRELEQTNFRLSPKIREEFLLRNP